MVSFCVLVGDPGWFLCVFWCMTLDCLCLCVLMDDPR